jgi:hypothetical protein
MIIRGNGHAGSVPAGDCLAGQLVGPGAGAGVSVPVLLTPGAWRSTRLADAAAANARRRIAYEDFIGPAEHNPIQLRHQAPRTQ